MPWRQQEGSLGEKKREFKEGQPCQNVWEFEEGGMLIHYLRYVLFILQVEEDSSEPFVRMLSWLQLPSEIAFRRQQNIFRKTACQIIFDNFFL